MHAALRLGKQTTTILMHVRAFIGKQIRLCKLSFPRFPQQITELMAVLQRYTAKNRYHALCLSVLIEFLEYHGI